MSGISESGGVPRLLGVVPAVAGPKSVPAPSTEVRLIGPPSSDVLISEAPRSEFRLLEPPSTGARLSEPPRSEYRLIGAPTSEVTLSGPQALPAAPAISTGEDRVPVIGGGAPERTSVIQPPEASAIHDHGLPYSGFDRLQDAVNAARYPDGSPLSAAHKKAIYDYYGLASEGLSDAGADAIADQLAILVRNRKNLMGTELNGNAYRPDADGAMVFDHLASFIRSPLNAAFEKTGKPELARQLLERITSPEKTHQGQDTLDCTLATLEGELAFTRPADFARIAVGLITRGEATLTDGTSMPLATFDPATAGGRSLIDMAVQSSMGALAAGTTHWDGQTTIGPKTSELLHEKVLGGDWSTITPPQVISFLLSLAVNPEADAILKSMGKDIDGIPKVTMRMPDGSLHAMLLYEATGFGQDGIGLWDPVESKLTTMNPIEFATNFVRATVPAKWFGSSLGNFDGEATDGEGGLTRSGARRTLA